MLIMLICVMSLPSGKHTKNYGKIHHFEWVIPPSMAIFNSFLYVYQAGYRAYAHHFMISESFPPNSPDSDNDDGDAAICP